MAPEPAREIVLFGRPGSGKSSIAERLHADGGYELVRTGELLRDAARRGDPLGLQVEAILKRGELAPDPVIEQLLAASLRASGRNRLLFDGFPRTLGQVPILEHLEQTFGFRIDRYLEIAIPRESAEARMLGRRVCPTCGATYHVVNQPPRVPETCDLDGSRLERRPDDRPEVIRNRQDVYQAQSEPVVAHYRVQTPDRFVSIDGGRAFARVYADARRALGLSPVASA